MNIGFATGLFILQLVHLYWLATDVIAFRLIGESIFSPSAFWEYGIIAVDYTEIPALIAVSLVYINDVRKKGFRWSSLFFLLLLNSQWLHLFWITDEFIVSQWIEGRSGTILPGWLAWVAIMIDYLELPVMVDTVRRFARVLFSEISSQSF